MAMLAELSGEFHRFWARLSSRNIRSSLHTWGPYPAQEPMLERACVFFRAEEAKNSQSLAAATIERLKHFDVAGMHRAVAICAYGRSGSALLASYLSGHADIILMPGLISQKIYPFFERYESMSLREKLIAFPFFQTPEIDNFLDFFGGDFPIGAADYYAAINAVFEIYGDWPVEVLESRRTFFQMLHVVYSVAQGRRPASRQPVIVYAQHLLDNELARRFIEDFPQGRFIQTVRDPITNTARSFKHNSSHFGLMAAWYVISYQTFAGLPHPGMESRTRVVRFEDLHLRLEETMRALVGWLGLSFSSTLLDSTFHDRPYLWRSGTQTWSGARPEAAIRDSQYTAFTDRCLLFVLLNEEFVAWNYPCPKIFRHASVRILTCILVLLIPLKMEIISGCELIKSLRSKGWRYGLNGIIRIFACRVGIMSLVVVELYRRIVLGKKVLEML
jgi:sulfotransferase family protein